MKWAIIRIAGLVLLLAGVAVLLPGDGTEAWTVPANCYDFTTGGGWFTPTPSGNDKANFGFEVGYKNGPPPPPLRGNLNYIDHNTGMHVKATSVDTYTAYSCTDASGRDCDDRAFSGSATVNGATGYSYAAEVIDDGEPGNKPKGHDRFMLTVSGPGLFYTADSGGAPCTASTCGIDGGNIEVHKECTSP